MSANHTYISGDWNLICDSCGKKIKAHQSKQRWDGFIVCSPTTTQGCWEPRQSLDFIRVNPDKQTVPFQRDEPADQFITVTYVDNGSTVPPGTFNPNTQ